MKRCLSLLVLLLLPALALADVGPSIHVQWLGPWPEPAVSGRPLDGRIELTWDGTSDRGTRSTAGVYFVRLATPGGTMNQTVPRLD